MRIQKRFLSHLTKGLAICDRALYWASWAAWFFLILAGFFPKFDLWSSPVHYFAASRVSSLKITHNSTGSSSTLSLLKPLETNCILISTCQVFSLPRWNTLWWVTSWDSSWLDRQTKCNINKAMFSYKELCTLDNPAILKDPYKIIWRMWPISFAIPPALLCHVNQWIPGR